MKKIQFKCSLLTDIIISQKSASEGNKETLDFIPGNNFLGIVASQLYKKVSPETSMTLFHSRTVRFGDAHPVKDGIRSMRIPASVFYPKLKKISDDELYIHHLIPEETIINDDFKKKQLKQCRSGFYTFNHQGQHTAEEIEIYKSFAIKSAYDRVNRRSQDEHMYTYESIGKGAVFGFEVEVEDESLIEDIKKALCGKKHIGRSRTAQYGLVEITETQYQEPLTAKGNSKLTSVYADGRLIFFDQNNQPTFQPTVKDLGLKDGKILYNKSQIRTFQYSPWNFQRQCYDTDRCGIEKGSVFVIENAVGVPLESTYIGKYNNEGFGKVIYNLDFLQSSGSDGKVLYHIKGKEEKNEEEKEECCIDKLRSHKEDNLLSYLANEYDKEQRDIYVYKIVNEFVKSQKDKFKSEAFASQWGSIRDIAMKHRSLESLKSELLEKSNAYLIHGIAKEKWDQNGRRKAIKEFLDKLSKYIDDNHLPKDTAQIALINLAAEMAKKCSKK